MDGTLTVGIHDFDGIKRSLGLPLDEPILEALTRVPEPQASQLRQQLTVIERQLAGQACRQAGAYELLSMLANQGCRLGVLTRNSKPTAEATLAVCGLDHFFEPAYILSRDCCAPKPSPAGILHLLTAWQAPPQEAVMVGDYVFDLEAGRQAGTATVYIDPTGAFPWQATADASVTTLATMVDWRSASGQG